MKKKKLIKLMKKWKTIIQEGHTVEDGRGFIVTILCGKKRKTNDRD